MDNKSACFDLKLYKFSYEITFIFTVRDTDPLLPQFPILWDSRLRGLEDLRPSNPIPQRLHRDPQGRKLVRLLDEHLRRARPFRPEALRPAATNKEHRLQYNSAALVK